MLNLESYLAEESGTRDMVTARQFGSLLEAKAERYTAGTTAKESFAHIMNIERIPDLASGISTGEILLGQVWDFRNSNQASRFRDWFDEYGLKSASGV